MQGRQKEVCHEKSLPLWGEGDKEEFLPEKHLPSKIRSHQCYSQDLSLTIIHFTYALLDAGPWCTA